MTDGTKLSLSDRHGHSHCLLCGDQNPWSLKLAFESGQDGSVRAGFKAHPRLQGYQGVLHGGVIAALLDAAMTHCLFHHGIEAYTADLHVRYAHAIPCNARLSVWAAMVTNKAPLYRLRAEVSHNDCLMAWGDAKFLIRRGNASCLGM